VENRGPTFAEIDRLNADRQAKKRECIERLTKILVKEFSLNELKFVQYFENSWILTEAFEIARGKARR
jgi:hypothetical protein